MSPSVTWSSVAPPQQGQPDGAAPRPSQVAPRRLGELAELVGATMAGRGGPDPEPVVSGVSVSSAQVRPGDLFAALPGASRHGVAFLDQALAAGAVAVLTDPAGAAELAGLDSAPPVLVTPDPRAAVGPLSAEVYGQPSRTLPVFGVTGTSGKTTTTFLVRAGLAAAGRRSGLIGTVGVFLGEETVKTPFTTPEAPQLQALLAVMRERGLDSVSMEVSSHALRLGRVDGIEFALAAFTNLSQDHLDFHADMKDYFAAKSLLFDGRARREIVVVDDEWGRQLVRPATVTVSAEHSAADWHAADVRVLADGSTRFTAHGPGWEFATGCRIPGGYNIANALLAFAILAEAGVEVAEVAPAVAAAQVRGRMERVDGDQPFLVVVDYSHKPAGVAGALRALRPLTAGRLIIVLGCGGDRDRGKRAVMGEVAATEADVLIVTDDNPRSEPPAQIRAAMIAGASAVPAGQRARVIEEGDRRAAIEQAIALAGAGDTVLIAGKGHETGQEVDGVLLAFDDVPVARQALAKQGYRDGEPGPAVADRRNTA
ncbi:MAG TPA: UDP-N-acetylmuramoyl-L-alanyl-D-glutamate--2,6-diaminopimelate ligase [Jatrophihabitans sp.]|uniref:UDP-N-acetylmuramoyl-L-alanyl-D-glutamate--2, 6-diaminopimelate ligase n=1 Tax=Jatrophihabitans sp. TaxID=1932789 RepID=UPI002F1BB04A